MPFELNRRQMLTGTALAVGSVVAGSALPATADTADPFLLGVASGDPLPDGVILWTRLVRDPLGTSPISRWAVPVGWQIAEDERCRRVVRSGIAFARPELAHSVHVDVRGLRPGRDYFYRFRVGREVSPVGRTRTAPARHADPDRLRFGVASCQDFQNGYWPAYNGLAAEDLDLVLHLGDYTYEYDPHSRFPDRNHTTPDTLGLDQLRTLADYRARHAQYKGDPALRAAHLAFPWVATWDDHEVENNYADLVDELEVPERHQSPEQFALQRAAGYQAYYEHMPIRADLRPGSSGLRIYRRFDYGRLARVNLLDTRQYRTDQPGGFGEDLGPEPPGAGNTAGTLTGAEQERWLTEGLARSHARWNVVAQQVMTAHTRFPNPTQVPPTIVNLDQWDGYQPQRERLLRFIAEARVANPVFLAGDIHSTWVNEIKIDSDDPAAPNVAVEFVGTSISSDFPVAFDGPIKQFNPILNPHVRYFNGLKRGYLRCEITKSHWRTDVRVVDSIETRESPTSTEASFVVESGQPVIIPA
ncbi:MAG TPA: alkaline phosphatase D family protein [Actinophytocola sp.]|uniref:alkaline phosphatase D family protein n=1 Tax=Actinophytocola sp. TaxID=1872138 RepID=UPI002DB56AC8|nr:alkaline phosphatase D family protein [Actinophytocola sp.]HEU5472523.1 alkaline phosphatase D family protein [Actinophytocola sp.]